MPRLLPAIAAVLFLLARAPAARAEATKKIAFRLEYESPADAACPTSEELGYAVAAEFGYLVVRADASALVRVEIRPTTGGVEAWVWGPDATRPTETWQGQTDAQATCRELAYDIASLLKAQLGRRAWPTDEPPPFLAAPPELEVGFPVLHPYVPRVPDSHLGGAPRQLEDVGLYSKDAPTFHMQAGAFGLFMPYGLTGVSVGGSGAVFLRWRKFALGGEVRGLITPASGIGDPPKPGRTSLFEGALLPCFVVEPIDLCAVATVRTIDFSLPSTVLLKNPDGLGAGFGAHLAARWPLGDRFVLAGYGEVAVEVRRTSIRWQDPTGAETPYNWTSPRVRAVVGVGIFFSMF